MRFFIAQDFQHLIVALFLGLAGALVIYLAFRYGAHRRPGKKEEFHEEYVDEAPTETNPVPPVLLFVYAGFLVWLIVYVILFALKGGPF